MSKNDSDFAKGFILGGLIGAGFLFLFGTEKGKKTQKILKKKGEEFLDAASETAGKVQKEGKKVKKELEEKAGEVKEDIGEKLENVGEKVKEEVEKGVDTALGFAEKTAEKGRDAQAKYFKKGGKPLS